MKCVIKRVWFFIGLLLALPVLSAEFEFQPLSLGVKGKSVDKAALLNFEGQLSVVELDRKGNVELYVMVPKEFNNVSLTRHPDAAIYINILKNYLHRLPYGAIASYADFISDLKNSQGKQKIDQEELEYRTFKYLSIHGKNYVRILFFDRLDGKEINQLNIRFFLDELDFKMKEMAQKKNIKKQKEQMLINNKENKNPENLDSAPKRKLPRKAGKTAIAAMGKDGLDSLSGSKKN